jgi:hypothetical protein
LRLLLLMAYLVSDQQVKVGAVQSIYGINQ